MAEQEQYQPLTKKERNMFRFFFGVLFFGLALATTCIGFLVIEKNIGTLTRIFTFMSFVGLFALAVFSAFLGMMSEKKYKK